MVFYCDSKIVYIGVLDGAVLPDNIFATTLKASQFLADMKAKYKSFIKDGKGKKIPLFDIITKQGLDNTIIKILKQEAREGIQELKNLLEITKKEYTPIEILVTNNKTTAGDTTIARYQANLKIVIKKLNIDNVKYFYENSEDVIKRIDELPLSLETKKNYFKSISSIIPDSSLVKIVYGNHLTSLSGKAETIINQQIKKPDVIYRTTDTLNKITTDLLKKGKIQEAVISIFYSGFYLPVFRIKEVITMKHKNYNKKTDNYIAFDDNEFILNDYKTVKLYRQQKVKISKYVKELILKLIADRDNQESDYLILNKNKPYNESDFSVKVSNIFGVNVNILRSNYITGKFNDGLINTEQDKIKLSKDMRNSVGVFKNYIKFEEDKSPIIFV